jgi:hypothetical protein
MLGVVPGVITVPTTGIAVSVPIYAVIRKHIVRERRVDVDLKDIVVGHPNRGTVKRYAMIRKNEVAMINADRCGLSSCDYD